MKKELQFNWDEYILNLTGEGLDQKNNKKSEIKIEKMVQKLVRKEVHQKSNARKRLL